MRSLFHEPDRAHLERRLERLSPDAPRRWGRMTPHQAVVHLTDSFRMGFGELLPDREFRVRFRPLVKWVAFTLPLPWPRGVQTVPELDQERVGSPPGDFAQDVDELKALMERFAASCGDLPPHPIWGRLSRGAWGRYGWRHVDHHLRQFGR